MAQVTRRRKIPADAAILTADAGVGILVAARFRLICPLWVGQVQAADGRRIDIALVIPMAFRHCLENSCFSTAASSYIDSIDGTISKTAYRLSTNRKRKSDARSADRRE